MAFSASAAWAEEIDHVSARDPGGVLGTLKQAGYDAELVEEEGETPYIQVELPIYSSAVLFLDCNDAEPWECDTLVFSTRFDRNSPAAHEFVAQANYSHRYISVWQDDKNRVFAQWALLTRDKGIPKDVFLNALVKYSGVVIDFGYTVFDNDTPSEEIEAAQEAAAS